MIPNSPRVKRSHVDDQIENFSELLFVYLQNFFQLQVILYYFLCSQSSAFDFNDMNFFQYHFKKFIEIQLIYNAVLVSDQINPSFIDFLKSTKVTSQPFEEELVTIACLLPEKEPHEMLLLLSRFSRVRLCATPQTAAHQAPPSLGFSRQEHWSGLPFPSPVHESEM